jgi:type IV secretion system protein VirB8
VVKEAESYFAEAARWEFDRAASLNRSARRAWIVAATGCGTTLLAIAAILFLMPLKRVDPFVVRVDSSTGIVDVVPGYAGTEELPEAVVRYLVTQYVMVRERFVPAIAEADYDQVGAYHTAAMNQAWAAKWARTNPESPLNRYADGSNVHAQVQSVSFLKHIRGGPDLIQVRFLSALKRNGAGTEERTHFVATLQASYGPPSSDVRLRALNPLGFKVLEYRREAEAVEPETTAPSNGPLPAPAPAPAHAAGTP